MWLVAAATNGGLGYLSHAGPRPMPYNASLYTLSQEENDKIKATNAALNAHRFFNRCHFDYAAYGL